MRRVGLISLVVFFIFVRAAISQASDPQGTVETSPSSADTEPSFSDLIFDQEDGMLDISAFLASSKGFLPAFGFITEPAVGNGGALGLLFLHDSIKNRAEQAKKRNPDGTLRRLPPPSISGVFGFGTSNGSWGGGLGHLHVFKDDKARYLGGAFYNEMSLDYYGRGGDLRLPVDHVSYSLDGYLLLQQLQFEVGHTNLYLGVNYKYLSFDSEFDFGLGLTPPPEFPPLSTSINSGGVGLIAEYDTRNTMFTPDSGINAKIEKTFFDPDFGSDNTFYKVWAKLRGWSPVAKKLILGFRCDGSFSGGDVPFYMLPTISLRGISLSRYQGQHTIASDAELRWDVTDRWSLVGFGGVGWVAEEDYDDFVFDEGKIAGGAGFRYNLSKLFGIRTGMDFAWSKDEFAFYMTTGTAWGP